MDATINKMRELALELEGLLALLAEPRDDHFRAVKELITTKSAELAECSRILDDKCPTIDEHVEAVDYVDEPEVVADDEPVVEPAPAQAPIPAPEPAPVHEPAPAPAPQPFTNDETITQYFPPKPKAKPAEPQQQPAQPTPPPFVANNAPQFPPVPDAGDIRVDEKLGRALSKDLRSAISLNDRFRFRQELFDNSDQELNNAFSMIENMKSYGEAEDYFYNYLRLDPQKPAVQEFMEILRRHFAD